MERDKQNENTRWWLVLNRWEQKGQETGQCQMKTCPMAERSTTTNLF